LGEIDVLRDIYYEVRLERFTWLDWEKIRLRDFEESTADELIFVAFVDGELAGFISIWEPDGFIHSIYVKSDFRGLGAGRRLIEEAVKICGLPLTLKCMTANMPSVGFYLSQGWKIAEEAMGDGGPYYRMRFDA